eukprot:TRINITY_DN1921_c0_g1_i1.p1 TRINITY_DN1921_c0_g1~~TRINITY_DN1921_c0_g1_i1.p1  ORF type:complete len:271 (+),score=120.57 TRINITY_DN1921_c0_g1_i1:54-866(+)
MQTIINPIIKKNKNNFTTSIINPNNEFLNDKTQLQLIEEQKKKETVSILLKTRKIVFFTSLFLILSGNLIIRIYVPEAHSDKRFELHLTFFVGVFNAVGYLLSQPSLSAISAAILFISHEDVAIVALANRQWRPELTIGIAFALLGSYLSFFALQFDVDVAMKAAKRRTTLVTILVSTLLGELVCWYRGVVVLNQLLVAAFALLALAFEMRSARFFALFAAPPVAVFQSMALMAAGDIALIVGVAACWARTIILWAMVFFKSSSKILHKL